MRDELNDLSDTKHPSSILRPPWQNGSPAVGGIAMWLVAETMTAQWRHAIPSYLTALVVLLFEADYP